MFKWDITVRALEGQYRYEEPGAVTDSMEGVHVEAGYGEIRVRKGPKVVAAGVIRAHTWTIDVEKVTVIIEKPLGRDSTRLYPDRWMWELRPHKMEEIVRSLWLE